MLGGIQIVFSVFCPLQWERFFFAQQLIVILLGIHNIKANRWGGFPAIPDTLQVTVKEHGKFHQVVFVVIILPLEFSVNPQPFVFRADLLERIECTP